MKELDIEKLKKEVEELEKECIEKVREVFRAGGVEISYKEAKDFIDFIIMRGILLLAKLMEYEEKQE